MRKEKLPGIIFSSCANVLVLHAFFLHVLCTFLQVLSLYFEQCYILSTIDLAVICSLYYVEREVWGSLW